MYEVEDDDFEINSATVFKQRASELASVKSLEETLNRRNGF